MSGPLLEHWAPRADLERIRADLARKGVARPTLEDLAVHDQLHAGLLDGTRAFVEWLGVPRGASVVDLGAGLGGLARWLARERGCTVTAIDLSPQLTETGRALTAWVGLDDQVRHRCADASQVDEPADRVVVQFVDMTVVDKRGLYEAVRRCLRPAGRAGWHDWLAGSGGPPRHPLFWSRDGALTHLSDEATFKTDLDRAGLVPMRLEAIPSLTTRWFERSRAGLAKVLGRMPPEDPRRPHLARLAVEVTNALANIEDHRLIPIFAEVTVSRPGRG